MPISTQIRAPRGVTNDRVHESIPFVSTCPNCRQPQPHKFSRAALLRLLNGGYPIEAYCAMCDEFWSISRAERVAITMQCSIGGSD